MANSASTRVNPHLLLDSSGHDMTQVSTVSRALVLTMILTTAPTSYARPLQRAMSMPTTCSARRIFVVRLGPRRRDPESVTGAGSYSSSRLQWKKST